MIRTTNIREGRISLENCRFVDEETYEKWTRRAKLQYGDVLLTREAPIGEVGFVDVPDGLFLGQRVMQYRANARVLHPRFLHYVFQSPSLQHQFGSHEGSGSVVSHIRVGDCFKFKIPLPPLEVQKGIAELLGGLDDRITLLRETNATLEAIAQALFKSWFVDFDPVHAKAAGLEPEGMDAATAALFPDSFEESELGVVPAGWKVRKVEDLLELPYGKALKATERVDGPVPVYGSGGITGYHNESMVKGPSVIVGRKGTVGSLYWEDRPFFPIDTVFYVRTDNPMTYCFYLLQTLGLDDMNTDGAVPGLNRNNAYRLPVVVAEKSILDSFDVIVSSLRDRIFLNTQHAKTITQLRDTLLPRLISGQLLLPEMETTVEAMLSEAV